jgi:hypothetical protein
MAGTTVTDISGLLKRVYDSSVKDVRPTCAILQRRHDFDTAKRVGESYQITVALSPPNGFTYVGSAGNIATLKAARTMVLKQASLTPVEIDLREQVAYAVMSRAAEQGEGAVKQFLSELMPSMQSSSANRIEGSMLHGGRNYGIVESVTDEGSNVAKVVFTAATWAPGLFWAYGPNSTWDSSTAGTVANTAALVLTQVNSKERYIRVTYTGAIGTQINVGDLWQPEGAQTAVSTFNDMSGYCAQASNTTGTSLGLSGTTYTNWQGNTEDIGGPISHQILEDKLAYLRDRGADAKLTAYISNRGFSALVSELAQLRNFDASYEQAKGKTGVRAISYFSADVGEVEIIPHPFMKWGEALILPDAECKRVGSSDITMEVPGMSEKFFQFVNGSNAVEFGTFTDQACALKKPNHSFLITGITYP